MKLDNPYLQIIRKLEVLEVEQKRLAALLPLFTVLNSTDVTALTADQTDYALGDFDAVLFNCNAARIIHGITGGVRGRFLIIRNISSAGNTLTFNHQSASAVATNRISTPSAANVTIGVLGTAMFLYSNVTLGGSSLRWLMLYPAS